MKRYLKFLIFGFLIVFSTLTPKYTNAIPRYTHNNTYPHIISINKDVCGINIAFRMNVELYNNGSFRQINSYQGGFVGLTNIPMLSKIKNTSHSVWADKFPTDKLYYTFQGTLYIRSYDKETNEKLEKEGFTLINTTKNISHYQKDIMFNGIYELYPENE